MCTKPVSNLSELKQSKEELLTISHIFVVQFQRRRGLISADSSQECMDRTSANLEGTQGHHGRVTDLFQNSDIFFHFKTRAAQTQVVSKLEFEFRTKWGAVSDFGFK